MAATWSPEDEQGFGIGGPDKGALTPEQQDALDDLRVQTARDNQEYLRDHPEVKAMLSLLIRETLLEERDVRTVAGELFHNEKKAVAGVRRMLGMATKHMPHKRRSADEDTLVSSHGLDRDVTFSDDMLRREHLPEEGVSPATADAPRMRRRDTPAPWIQHELELLTHMVDEISSQDTGRRQPSMPWLFGSQERRVDISPEDGTTPDLRQQGYLSVAWLQSELEKLAQSVDEGSAAGSGYRPASVPWMLAGKSSSQLPSAATGDDSWEAGEDIPLGRRDTPAPWSTENNLLSQDRRERETYVLGLLEKILEEPTDNDSAFEKLDKIVEGAE